MRETLHPDFEAYLDSIADKGANRVRARRASFAGLSPWWTEMRGQPFEPALLAERDVHTRVCQHQVKDVIDRSGGE